MDDKTVGLLCHKDRKFYMYDPGPATITNSIDRIRNYLIMNNLAYLMDEPNVIKNGYKVMTLGQAKLENLEVVTIYANQHVKTQKQKGAEDTAISVWD